MELQSGGCNASISFIYGIATQMDVMPALSEVEGGCFRSSCADVFIRAGVARGALHSGLQEYNESNGKTKVQGQRWSY